MVGIIIMETKEQNLLELAWGLIANANEGDWDKATKEWKEAAERWRDEYHKTYVPLKNEE